MTKPVNLVAVWSESVSHIGPHDGCSLDIFDADESDSCPIYGRDFKRQIAQISIEERCDHEARAMREARRLIAAAYA